MQILIHNSQYFHQKYGGVSRYSSCLLKNLAKKKLDINLIAPIYKNRYLKDIKNIKKKGFYLPKYPNLKILRVLNNRLIELYKKNIKADVIHDLYYPENEKNYLKKKLLQFMTQSMKSLITYIKIIIMSLEKKLLKKLINLFAFLRTLDRTLLNIIKLMKTELVLLLMVMNI